MLAFEKSQTELATLQNAHSTTTATLQATEDQKAQYAAEIHELKERVRELLTAKDSLHQRLETSVAEERSVERQLR